MSFTIDTTKVEELLEAGNLAPFSFANESVSDNATPLYPNLIDGVTYDALILIPRIPGAGKNHIAKVAHDFDDTLEIGI
jgi:hypothetical protein